MKKAIRIEDDVHDVLNRSTVDGHVLRLPPGQLDRKLYERVNKALEALGGAWNRSKKGHVFDCNPKDAIAAALDSGKVAHPNEHDFFPTSRTVAETACRRLAMGSAWKRTLEPSAGEGDLIAPLVEWLGQPSYCGDLQFFEKDPRRLAALRAKSITSACCKVDFLTVDPEKWEPFRFIIMNPPFHMGADAQHIGHALNFLAPGGRLVAIASAGFKARGTKATKAVRDRIYAWGGTIEDLPEGSFKEAGTNVATVLITVDRPVAS